MSFVQKIKTLHMLKRKGFVAVLAVTALLSLFCVISAYAMERIGENDNQAVALGVPLITITAAVGVAVYLQNMLTYSRLPMSF